MGWGSILGTIGGAIAAPFTGGASLIPALVGAASAAGNIAGARAQGRQSQAQANTQQDALRTQQYQAQQNALLDAGKLALQAPGYRMGNMVRGSMLANAQPMQISHPRATIPSMSGGFDPNQLLSPAARQMGSAVQRQTLLDQMRGDDASKYLVQPPGVTAQPKASWLDNILGAAGMIGGIGGGAYYGGKNIRDVFAGGGPPLPPSPTGPTTVGDVANFQGLPRTPGQLYGPTTGYQLPRTPFQTQTQRPYYG